MLVEYLLTECQCDPNFFDSKGRMALQLTLDSRIMKTLVEHGAKVTTDIVYKIISSVQIIESEVVELMALSSRKGTMLWHPADLNRDGITALDLAYSFNKLDIVKYLLTETKCDPNADNYLKLLLELTKNLNFAKFLIEHGAKVTPDLVLRFEAMEAMQNKCSLIKLMLTTWNPNDRDSDGYTALHLASKADRPITVMLLLSVAHCNPDIKSKHINEELPIQLTTDIRIMKMLVEHDAKMTTDVIFKVISSVHIMESRAIELLALSSRKGTMLWHPTDVNRNGETALDLAYSLNKPDIVNYLLAEAKCDPNAINSLLKLTTSLNFAILLIKHGAKATPELILEFEAMEATLNKEILLKQILTTWNPDDRDIDGYTALHLACKGNRLTLAKLLLSVAHCDPNVKSKNINEELPIQLTTDFRIMQTLVEHGARMTTNIVFNLISMHNTDSRVSDLFELSVTKETMLWNPNDLNSNGYTALHLACKANRLTLVKRLLSVAHCDPNVKSKNINEELPIQLTTDLRIMQTLVEHGAQMTTDVVFNA